MTDEQTLSALAPDPGVTRVIWESKAAESAAAFVDAYVKCSCRHTEAVADCPHCNLTFLAAFARRSIAAVESLNAALARRASLRDRGEPSSR